jgi:hypothetical protein
MNAKKPAAKPQAAAKSQTFAPGRAPRTVRSADGKELAVPPGWILLEPGDAGLTRRVKAAGEHWVVQDRRGRRIFTYGVWAASATIERIRAELEAERATDAYAKRQEASARRRDRVQGEYVEDFARAVLEFLDFHPQHAALAERLSRAVARTKRIPVERRAEAAVIAWLRHQTTAYDSMKIARVAGRRREVRRMLADRSRELLDRYRRAEIVTGACPLRKALDDI